MTRRMRLYRATLIGVVVALGAFGMSRPSPVSRMAGCARSFLDSLEPAQRAKAGLLFDGPERTTWSFVPGARAGLSLGEMNDKQRGAAHDLLRSGLSATGYLKVTAIVELETVLREMESSPARDPERYIVAVFGDPGGQKPWGWKFEGHHVCLNFASATGEVTAVTPVFLGANPAEVRKGRRAGWRVLAAEEDLGRELVKSLDDAQRERAIVSSTAPGDIILGPGRGTDLGQPAGLLWTEMNESQRALLWRLVRQFADNLQGDLAQEQVDRIQKAGVEGVRFAWAGRLEVGQGHYYRIQGPTFVIEYDNTQNNANHVHTVWRDPERDFGRDVLSEHYRQGGHEKGGK